MKGFSGFKSSPAKQKVDPDAPGTPKTPGYEPPVKRSDLDAKGKAIWDQLRETGVDKVIPGKKSTKKQSRMMKEGEEIQKFIKKNQKKSPAKQKVNKGGEAQDQNKIFNKKGKHVGDYVNGKAVYQHDTSTMNRTKRTIRKSLADNPEDAKKVYKTLKARKSTESAHGQLSDAQYEFEQDLKNAKRKTKTTRKAFPDLQPEKKPAPTKKIEGSKAMRDKVAGVTKANLNVVNKLRRDQGKSDLTDPNKKTGSKKKTDSKKKPAPTKLAPLVAMAGKAILGKVAGKVAGKLINGNKKEE